jgi:prepilin-type N-terminal cleavage/methylation domain-containing protein
MRRGFTLIEVVIVIAVLAILAAVLVPVVGGNIRSARTARASADAKTLGEAIVRFRQDLGFWPLRDAAAAPVQELNGPGSFAQAADWLDWNVASKLDMVFHLVLNGNNYRNDAASRAQGLPCWNGPYVNQVNPDPWGHPFLANVTYLEGGPAANTALRVYVISAGANGAIETTFAGSADLAGDDAGFRLQ